MLLSYGNIGAFRAELLFIINYQFLITYRISTSTRRIFSYR